MESSGTRPPDWRAPVRWAEINSKRTRCRLKPEPAKSSPIQSIGGALLLVGLASLAGHCAEATSEHQQPPPVVSLPKMGLIRGIRLADGPNADEKGAVAAFLGVPYAAPPTGPLRFMPPGALRSSQRGASVAGGGPGACQAGGRGAAVPMRVHAKFAAPCVQLADWLEQPAGGPLSDQRGQSEDCLNLNLFVPYEPLELERADRFASARRSAGTADASGEAAAGGSAQQDLGGSGDHRAPDLARWGDAFNGSQQQPGGISISPSAEAQGHLPYIDDLAQYQHLAAGPAGGQARYNHAIWDQLGLLHWLRHNVAHFNGDSRNITLASTDNKSAKLLQLLATSPIAKGLFKRLILIHDQRQADPAADSGQESDSNLHAQQQAGGEYLDRLLGLARQSRKLKRKLINELGLIVRRIATSDNFTFSGNSNLDLDRNMFEFLKLANLSQLALIEAELAKLKLIDLISEPNLDDRLLFPYFAQLTKMHHLMKSGGKSGDGDDDNRISGRRGRLPSSNGTGEEAGELAWSAGTQMALQFASNDTSRGANRMELEYCLYIGRLYDALHDKIKPGDGAPSGPLSLQELAEFDPFRLVPRVNASASLLTPAPQNLTSASLKNHHKLIQKTSSAPWLSPWSWFIGGGGGGATSAADKEDLRAANMWSGSGNWTQSRQVSATEFYHLRHMHLLDQLLGQKFAAKSRASAGAANVPSDSSDTQNNRYTGDDDDDDDEDEGMLRKQQRTMVLQQQQQQQQDAPAGALSRTRRDGENLADQLVVLSEQLLELVSSYDLLIGFIGHTRSTAAGRRRNQPPLLMGPSEVAGIKEKLINLSGSPIDQQLVFWLQTADFHSLANWLRTEPNSPLARDANAPANEMKTCDFISDNIQRIKRQYQGSEPEVAYRVRANQMRAVTYVFLLSPDGREDASAIQVHEDIWTRGDIGYSLGNFIRGGRPTGVNGPDGAWPTFDTMNRRVKLFGATNRDEFRQLVDLNLNVIPYLEQNYIDDSSTTSGHSNRSAGSREQVFHSQPPWLSPPRNLGVCLNELEFKLKQNKGSESQASSNHRNQLEFHCLAKEISRLRGQLRTGASRDLEPLLLHMIAASMPPSSRNVSQLLRSRQLGALNQRVSPIATRNLVNQSEEMALEQPDSVGLSDQALESRALGLSPAPNDTGATTATVNLVSSKHHAYLGSESTVPGVRGFLAKAYKDAVGQALAIVIGTGALIFSLNLIIVLVIAIRSSRKAAGGGNQQDRRHKAAGVRDLDQVEFLATAISAGGANGLAPFGGSLGASDGNSMEARQLMSSFRGAQSGKQEAPADLEPSTRKRSIKFDLSNVRDHTSREDDHFDGSSDNGADHQHQLPTGTHEKGYCSLHGAQYANQTHQDCASHQQQQQQKQRLASSSPAYLFTELSDELEAPDEAELSLAENLHRFAGPNTQMRVDGGAIYVTYQSHPKLVDATELANYNQGQQQHHLTRSLGSSSLTSPFASQSSPTNNTSTNSTGLYTIRPSSLHQADMVMVQSLQPYGAPANQDQLQQQQQLYSPASSTMSSEPAAGAPGAGSLALGREFVLQQQMGGCKHHGQTDAFELSPLKRRTRRRAQLASPAGKDHSLSSAGVQLFIMPDGGEHGGLGC